MRLVFYGTPALAVPPLQRLVSAGHAPELVVTRADRPKGRGLKSGKSAVREAADALRLPVATPKRAGAREEIGRVASLAPDLLIVVAYGQILPPALLSIPKLGAINLHYSLLPRHRGASPIQASILAGDRETGVTVMWMTEGLDEGPVFFSRATEIGEGEDAGSLGSRLARLGADCMIEALDRIDRGESSRHEQDHAAATYAPKLTTDAGLISFERPAEELARRVRAFTPEPGAFIPLERGRLIVTSASAATGGSESPGTVIAIDPARGIKVSAADGSIWLESVRPSGRRDMGGSAYANGARLKPGDRLAIAPVKA